MLGGVVLLLLFHTLKAKQRRIILGAIGIGALAAVDQLLDAGNFRRQRTRADQAHHHRDVHGVMRLARFRVGEAEGREGGGRQGHRRAWPAQVLR